MAHEAIPTPKPQQPDDPVSLRLRVTKGEYKDLRRLAVESDRPVGDLLREGVELLLRRYQAEGIELDREEDRHA